MAWTVELDLERPGTSQFGKDWDAREVLAEAIKQWLARDCDEMTSE